MASMTRYYNAVPPPRNVSEHTLFWVVVGSGVAAFGLFGVIGLIAWLTPGVPPPGPLG